MAELKNPRHELFAQGLAKGMSATAAHEAAGYVRNQGNSSRLKSKHMVTARVAELQQAGATAAGVTVERIVKELWVAYGKAQAANQHGPAMMALQLLGRTISAFVDRTALTIEGGLADSALVDKLARGNAGLAAALREHLVGEGFELEADSDATRH